MKRKSVVVLLSTAVLGLCFAAVTIAQAKRVPVRATFTGQIQRTQTSETPPAWSVKATGPIQIMGLGAGTIELVYDKVELAPAGDNLQAGATEGTGTLTLATGDKAFGTIRWLTSPTSDPNVLSIVGTVTVTGGTGRFANAKGSGIAVGEGNVPKNEVRFTLQGFLEGLGAPEPRTPGFGPR
jgi:hypothetical protein